MSNDALDSSVNATGEAEDKIVRSDSRMDRGDCGFETTADGDVLVVQPSFDDTVSRSKTPTISPQKSAEWQGRSPDGDTKESDQEERNPSSPLMQKPKRAGHSRSLSGRFFESTTISDEATEADRSKDTDSDFAGRKHRRMFSGDATNPNNAHRRINSIGQAASVARRHHREDSGGLDILSAVAHSTKEELAAASGSWEAGRRGPYPPPPMRSMAPSRGYDGIHPGYAGHPSGAPLNQHPMNPPPHRRMPYPPPHGSYPPPYSQSTPYYNYQAPPPQHGSAYYPPPPHHRSSYSPPRARFMAPYPPQHEGHPRKSSAYKNAPPELHVQSGKHVYERRAPSPPTNWHPESSHQGSQTFVTSIAVGSGNKMIPASNLSRTVATNTEEQPVNKPPSEIGHHRKLSSFSSLGTLGPSLFPGGGPTFPRDSPGTERPGVSKKGHHRTTSSSVSFLQGFDVGLEMNNDSFLRNLQASNEAPVEAAMSPVPPPSSFKSSMVDSVPVGPASVTSTTSPHSDSGGSQSGGTKLAAGGTSKRVRRKCTVAGCGNRVVQGGLCISHGAKRKTCKHPGCNKNVKKAGLCSTHGPARKRCDHPGCPKVAVQGGRCISHGAKKKLCSVTDCSKQAILSGMCKKHHDQTVAQQQSSQYCRSTQGGPQPTHTRGLSFFQEISPDTISNLLNEEKPPEQQW